MNHSKQYQLAQHLVAHRGQQRDFPENSLAGLKAAAHAGITALEIDVQLSADGVAMLYHDVSLQRVSGLQGRIFDFSAEELGQMPAHEPGRLGDRFPTTRIEPLRSLIDILREYPSVSVFVEMKPESIDQFGITASRDALLQSLGDYLKRCTVISFHQSFIDQLDAGINRGIVVSDAAQLVDDNAYEVIFCNTRWLEDGATLPRHSPVAVYEVTSVEQTYYWLDRGVRWIESHDAIGLLNNEKQQPAD